MAQEVLLYSGATDMLLGMHILQMFRGEAQSLKKCSEISWRENDVMLLLKIIFNLC